MMRKSQSSEYLGAVRSGKGNIKHEGLKWTMRLAHSRLQRGAAWGREDHAAWIGLRFPTIKAEAKLNRGSRLTNAPLPKMATPSFPEPINTLPYMARGTLQM